MQDQRNKRGEQLQTRRFKCMCSWCVHICALVSGAVAVHDCSGHCRFTAVPTIEH